MNVNYDVLTLKEKKKSNSMAKSIEIRKESFSKAIQTPQSEIERTLKNNKKKNKKTVKKVENDKILITLTDRKNSMECKSDNELDAIVPRNVGQSKILIYENNIKDENTKTLDSKVNEPKIGKIIKQRILSNSNSKTLLESKNKVKNLPKIIMKKTVNLSNERYNSFNKVNSNSKEKNVSKSYKEEVTKLEKLEKNEMEDNNDKTNKIDKSSFNNNRFSAIKNKYKSSLPLINEKNVNENKKATKKSIIGDNNLLKKSVINTDSGITSLEKQPIEPLKKSFYNERNKFNLSQSVKINFDNDKVKQYFQNEYSKYSSDSNNIKIIKNKKDLNQSVKLSVEKKQSYNTNSFNNKDNATSLDPIYTVRYINFSTLFIMKTMDL